MPGIAVVNLIVPFWDQIVQWASGRHAVQHHTGLAEWDAAIHAARPLLSALFLGEGAVKLIKIADAFQGTSLRCFISLIL